MRFIGPKDLVRHMLSEQIGSEKGLNGDSGPKKRPAGASSRPLEIHCNHTVHAHHLQQTPHVGRYWTQGRLHVTGNIYFDYGR